MQDFIHWLVGLAVGVFLVPVPVSASAISSFNPISAPFGGKIIAVLPCLTAPGFFAADILEPGALGGINTYILSPTSPYLSHVPPHPGQNVLGRTTGMYSCIIDLNPKHYIVWVDPISVFYGSSAI